MYRKRYSSQTLRGKLKVARYLENDRRVRAYVPRTRAFTRANLKAMLGLSYPSVYVKPNIGSQGMGIYKVKRHAAGGYQLTGIQGTVQRKRHFTSIDALYRHLASTTGRKRMIVQRGIALDRVNGRPYDIRVMVQRNPGQAWVCTGHMAKVGRPGKIVTNYYQGGQIYTLKRLFRLQRLKAAAQNSRTRQLTRTAVLISNALSAKKAGMHEMGIDFAYDQKRRLWVLEVNSNHPQFHPLRRIAPAMYRRMRSFAASYGRHDA